MLTILDFHQPIFSLPKLHIFYQGIARLHSFAMERVRLSCSMFCNLKIRSMQMNLGELSGVVREKSKEKLKPKFHMTASPTSALLCFPLIMRAEALGAVTNKSLKRTLGLVVVEDVEGNTERRMHFLKRLVWQYRLVGHSPLTDLVKWWR